jgi:hypothetical protein
MGILNTQVYRSFPFSRTQNNDQRLQTTILLLNFVYSIFEANLDFNF